MTKAEITPISAKNYVVLVVEDDITLSRLYSEQLKFEGFNVIVANDGETGLKLAKEKNPDFILLDMMLPKHTGFEIMQDLMDHPRGKHIPVLALSNLTERVEANKALQMGAKDYLAKAMYTPEQIVDRIKEILQANDDGGQ